MNVTELKVAYDAQRGYPNYTHKKVVLEATAELSPEDDWTQSADELLAGLKQVAHAQLADKRRPGDDVAVDGFKQREGEVERSS